MEYYERENRIKEALEIRNMRQVDLCEATGLSKGIVSNWIKQRWQPRQTPLFLMARALNVSEMWLAGYDVPMERTVTQQRIDEMTKVLREVRDNERYYDLVCQIIKLPEEQFLLIESMVKQLGGK